MRIRPYNPEQPIIEQYSSALVVGLGITGYSVIRYLYAHGLDLSVMDSRKEPPCAAQLSENYADVKCYFGPFATHQLEPQTLLVVSPGVSLNEPFIREHQQKGARIVGDIELFIQGNERPLIAITGSNGKSTVTTLVGLMCSADGMTPLVAGNIGMPALDALTDTTDYDIAVLELSSFQLETTSQVPAKVSAILNVSEDHLDRYSSMGDYLLAKARILRGAHSVVLPRHDRQLMQITSVGDSLSFGLDEPANDSEFGVSRVSGERWLVKGKHHLMRLRDVSLMGLHNIQNVLAAFALVDFLQLPLAVKVAAVKSFTGLQHRMQTVCITKNVTWVNDSKATNVGATSTALRSLEADVIWIAGGQSKGADFTQLRDAVTSNIKLLVLFGEDADLMQTALQGSLPIVRVNNMTQAIEVAGGKAKPQDIVLLSPACASFDMYTGFDQRGDDFVRQVDLWSKQRAGAA